MRAITVWCLEQLAIIIKCQSGVQYLNQVGGYACIQAQQEGVLAPLEDIGHVMLAGLGKLTLNETSLSEEQADQIDEVLQNYYGRLFLRVDRELLELSMEAWIHIVIGDDAFLDELDGFAGEKGILTWENSD